MDLEHVADGAGLDDFDDLAVVVAAVDLRAELGDELGFAGQVCERTRFANRVGQWLLAQHVLAGAH